MVRPVACSAPPAVVPMFRKAASIIAALAANLQIDLLDAEAFDGLAEEARRHFGEESRPVRDEEPERPGIVRATQQRALLEELRELERGRVGAVDHLDSRPDHAARDVADHGREE